MRIITAYGIPGYGPDASDDNFGVHSSWVDVADEVRRMLDSSADGLGDSASASAGQGDYETAWNTRKQADELYNLAANLSNTRADAPLYRGDAAMWDAEIERIIGENFPYDVDSGCRIYVWADDAFGMDECPCCKRPAESDDLVVVCGECAEAGDLNQEHATYDQPYPYCAATDSSPLA